MMQMKEDVIWLNMVILENDTRNEIAGMKKQMQDMWAEMRRTPATDTEANRAEIGRKQGTVPKRRGNDRGEPRDYPTDNELDTRRREQRNNERTPKVTETATESGREETGRGNRRRQKQTSTSENNRTESTENICECCWSNAAPPRQAGPGWRTPKWR